MAINIENPNEFIMKKNLLWHHNLPLDDIGKAMDEARAEGYKQGQIDAVKHLFENKIAIVRAVKVLSSEMQDVAKKAGYKPDDVLFITMEKIEGSIVEWQIKNGLVLKKVD